MCESTRFLASGSRHLEGKLHVKEEGKYAILLVHPYAALGGSMVDPVINKLFRTAMLTGSVGAAMVYNQAGVGNSDSRRFWQKGDHFKDCASAAIHLLNAGAEGLALVVIGYSFGCCIACGALREARAVILVAPPIGIIGSTFLGARRLLKPLASFGGPVFIIQGDSDQFVALNQVKEVLCSRSRPPQGSATSTDVQALAGCDHFFTGHTQSVAEMAFTRISRLTFAAD